MRGLGCRYVESYRTRKRGHENRSPEATNESLLSDGPVAAVDRAVLRARVSDLPLGPEFSKWRNWNLLKQRDKDKDKDACRAKGLKPALRPYGFFIKQWYSGRRFGSDALLYLEDFMPAWDDILLPRFADALVRLTDLGLIDLGEPGSRFERARALLKQKFGITEFEFRIDLPPGLLSQGVRKALARFDDGCGHFTICCRDHRHERGWDANPYMKSMGTFRAEINFLGKYWKGVPVDTRSLGHPESILRRLWPDYLRFLTNLRHQGRKPELDVLIEAVQHWTPIDRRIAEIGVEPSVVEEKRREDQARPKCRRVL